MPTRRRHDHIYKRAYELAASGLHINAITIVSALVNEGYPEAAELLNSEIIRSDLRQVCTRHWQGVAESEDRPPKTAAKPPQNGRKDAGTGRKRPSPSKE